MWSEFIMFASSVSYFISVIKTNKLQKWQNCLFEVNMLLVFTHWNRALFPFSSGHQLLYSGNKQKFVNIQVLCCRILKNQHLPNSIGSSHFPRPFIDSSNFALVITRDYRFKQYLNTGFRWANFHRKNSLSCLYHVAAHFLVIDIVALIH